MDKGILSLDAEDDLLIWQREEELGSNRETDMARKVTTEANAKRPDGKVRLILAALRLFSEQGYGDVSTRSIASEADVSLQLIWHHFGTKEALRDAVDDYVTSRMADLVQGLGTDFASIEERLSELGVRVSRFMSLEGGHAYHYWRRMLLEPEERGDKAYAVIGHVVDEISAGVVGKAKVKGAAISAETIRIFMLSIFAGPILLGPHLDKELGVNIYEPKRLAERMMLYRELLAHLLRD